MVTSLACDHNAMIGAASPVKKGTPAASTCLNICWILLDSVIVNSSHAKTLPSLFYQEIWWRWLDCGVLERGDPPYPVILRQHPGHDTTNHPRQFLTITAE